MIISFVRTVDRQCPKRKPRLILAKTVAAHRNKRHVADARQKERGRKDMENKNEKIDEAIEYAKWMLKSLDPDDVYNFEEVRRMMLEMIGYLTTLKI